MKTLFIKLGLEVNTLFIELGLEVLTPPVIWCDNQCAITLSSNLVFHACITHTKIDVHYIRDQVAAKHVTI